MAEELAVYKHLVRQMSHMAHGFQCGPVQCCIAAGDELPFTNVDVW